MRSWGRRRFLRTAAVGGGLAAAGGPTVARASRGRQDAEWIRSIPSTADDVGEDVVATDDGGTLIVGTRTGGRSLVVLTALSSGGEERWRRTYVTGQGKAILEAHGGGYFVAGTVTGEDGGGRQAPFVFEVDAEGTREMGSVVDLDDEGLDFSTATAARSPDGYVIAGRFTGTGGDTGLGLIGIDVDGNRQWIRQYGLPAYGTAVEPASDGGHLVVATLEQTSRSPRQALLLRVGADGRELWRARMDGPTEAWAATEVGTEEYVVAGARRGSAGFDGRLVKVTGEGTVEWERTHGGDGNEYFADVVSTADGFLCAGNTSSFGPGDDNVYLVGTDAEGSRQWERAYGTEGTGGVVSALTPGPDGTYYGTGELRADTEHALAARFGVPPADDLTVPDPRTDDGATPGGGRGNRSRAGPGNRSRADPGNRSAGESSAGAGNATGNRSPGSSSGGAGNGNANATGTPVGDRERREGTPFLDVPDLGTTGLAIVWLVVDAVLVALAVAGYYTYRAVAGDEDGES